MKNKLSGMKRPSALLRRIQPIAVWLLAVVLIGLGGCEKDRFAELEKEPGDALSLPRFKSLNHPETCESCEASGKPYQTLDDFPALRARILTQLQAAEPESRYYAGILDGSVISSVNGDITTYTIFWQTVGNTIYKLLVRTNSAGNVAEMGVLRITPEQSFLSGYFQSTTLLKDFVGEIGVVTVGDFLDAKRSGSFKSLGRNKSAIDDCQRLIFVNGGPIGGNGGGGQTENPPGSDPIVRGPGPIWNTGGGANGGSPGGGGCWEVSLICGCNKRHAGGTANPQCPCRKPDIIEITPCSTDNTLRGRTTLPGLEPQAQGDKGTPGRNKNLWWDCVDLLNGAGLLTDHDLYLLRLRECDQYMAGFEGDVSDGATAQHPDADFCSVWKPYYDRCLSQLPANATQNRWAALMRRNRALFNKIISSDNSCKGEDMRDFLEKQSYSDEAMDFLDYALDLMETDQEIKWDRLEELFELVENDPDALVKDCITGQSMQALSFWADLASFTPPPVVMNRINSLPGGVWQVQDISNANSKRVNFDYFPVRIDRLPTVNGATLSADAFLNHIRRNINDFTDGPEFNPFSQDDITLWHSNDPLSTVISINIFPDNGTVITSQFEPCCWVFTTLKTPPIYDGTHPVSGNRQFGYIQNQDGSFTFYSKGADRLTSWYHALSAPIAFGSADELWRSFQNYIKNYADQHGGAASIQQEFRFRPNWETIRDLIKSNTPITTIPCH
jgi:hypothetical protein